MIKRIIMLCVVSLIIFSSWSHSDAYENETTHRQITERVVRTAVSDVNDYLIYNLGMSGGFEATVGGKPILEWLQDGSEDEDYPGCRASNHFHDPLLPWDKSFMNDDTSLLGRNIRVYCTSSGWDYFERKSAVTWATGYLSPPPEGPKATFNPHVDYAPINWDNAREYYYTALTSALETERDNHLGLTFEAVGHVLHLLQDVSVPAHVRNDLTSHLIFNGIAFTIPPKWVIQPFEHYVKKHDTIVKSAQDIGPSFTDVRLTDFWDTNQITYDNPSASNPLGLAEFTNANYFSDNTILNNIPSAEHTYLYPAVDSENYQICEGLDDETGLTRRKYISRSDRGSCPPPETGTTDHFAAVSLLNEEIEITADNIFFLKLVLDGNVHNTYAKELIPRAVGYSAELLKYFFRGTIEISPPIELVHSTFYDLSSPLIKIRVWLRNGTVDEEMNEGELVAVARYIETGETSFKYSISTPKQITSLSSTEEKIFEFDFSNDPVPVDIQDLSFQVVFKGTLGNEEDIALAVGRRDLNTTIEIVPPDTYVYSIVDGVIAAGTSQQEFSKIKVRMKTFLNPIDAEGSILAIAKYRKRTNYQADLSEDPPIRTSIEDSFSSSTSEPIPIQSLDSMNQTELVFDFTNDPIPVGITDLYLDITYQADSDSTVVAAGMKDLNEPMHLVFWNNTDSFLLNGEARKAEDIENDPDVDSYGHIYPHPFTEEISFGAIGGQLDSAPVVLTLEDLPPARYSRIIVLVDGMDGYLVKDHLTSPSPTNDNLTWIYSFPGVINQEDDREVWGFTPVYSIRGITQHQMTYFIRVYPNFVYAPYAFPAPPENSQGPYPATVNFP